MSAIQSTNIENSQVTINQPTRPKIELFLAPTVTESTYQLADRINRQHKKELDPIFGEQAIQPKELQSIINHALSNQLNTRYVHPKRTSTPEPTVVRYSATFPHNGQKTIGIIIHGKFLGEGSHTLVKSAIWIQLENLVDHPEISVIALKKMKTIKSALLSNVKEIHSQLPPSPYIEKEPFYIGNLSPNREFALTDKAVCSLDDYRFADPSTIWEIINDITSGVLHVHGNGFMLRDIKPENILVYEKKPRFRHSDLEYMSEKPSSVAGTYCYLAPESFLDDQNKDQSQAGDIYALGIVIQELISQYISDQIENYINLIRQHPQFSISNKACEQLRQFATFIQTSRVESAFSKELKDPKNYYECLATQRKYIINGMQTNSIRNILHPQTVPHLENQLKLVEQLVKEDPTERPNAAKVLELAAQLAEESFNKAVLVNTLLEHQMQEQPLQ